MVIKFGKKVILDLRNMSFLEFYLPFYSILIYYTLPIVGSVGQIILFAYLLCYLFFCKHRKAEVPKWLFAFFIISIPIQIMDFYRVGGFNASRAVNLFMIAVYIFLLSSLKIRMDGLIRIYKFVALIASILIIVQFVQINFLGQVVHQIMVLPVERPEAWYQGGIRPQGLFPEPQVYATFILPLLVLCLEKKEYMWSGFLTISVVVSTSTLGILCSIGIWFYYVMMASIRLSRKVLIIGCAFIVLIMLIKTPIFSYAIEKILNTDFTNNVRLTRGFLIYDSLSDFNKLFGIGVNNLAYYSSSGQIILNDTLSRTMTNSFYITTVAELLVNYGAIAAVIYLGMMINLFRNSTCKLLVIILIVLSFGQTILFSGVWYMYMVIIMSTLRKDNNCFITKN